MGEVDYTEVESYKLQAFSANRNRDINLNDSFKSHFKRQLLSSLQRIWLGQGIRLWPLSIIKESVYRCTLSTFTASLKLGNSRLPYALQINGPECTSARTSSRFPATFIDQSVLAAKAPVVVVLLTLRGEMLEDPGYSRSESPLLHVRHPG